MIITFCGHSQFLKNDAYEQMLLDFLEENIGDKPADMYLGGYGLFDSFAYECCKKYKTSHSNVSLVFVTPYQNREYLEGKGVAYDYIIYPDIENVPPKFAISHRNRYMINAADYVVAYVSHAFGGAYTAYAYAKKKGKCIFNLAGQIL